MCPNTLARGERKALKVSKTKTSDPGYDNTSQPERAKERELIPPSLKTGSNQVYPPMGGEKALEKPTSEKLFSPRENQSSVKDKHGDCENVEMMNYDEDFVVVPAPHVSVVTVFSWPRLKKLKEQLRLVRANGYIVERSDFITPRVMEKVLDAYVVFTKRRSLDWNPDTLGDLSDDEFFSRIEQCLCQNHVGVEFDDIVMQSEYTVRRLLSTYTGLSLKPVNDFLFKIEEEMEKANVKEPSEDLVQEMAVLIFDMMDIDPNIAVVVKHTRCELAKMLREEWAKAKYRKTWKNLSQLIRVEASKLRDSLAVAYRCGLEMTTAGKELAERDFYLYCQSQWREWSLKSTSQQPQSSQPYINNDRREYSDKKRHAEHESRGRKKQKISPDTDDRNERISSFISKEDMIETSFDLSEDIQCHLLQKIQSFVVNREPSFNKGEDSPLYFTQRLYRRDNQTQEDRLKIWNQFESFLEGSYQQSQGDKKKIIIVDGANIGYYKQNYPGAPLYVNYHQINRLIEQLTRYHDYFPIIILHARHLLPAIDSRKSPEEYEQVHAILGGWRKAGYLYATPKGFNDDWFWMYASIKYQCYIITNDDMRDHYLQLLCPR